MVASFVKNSEQQSWQYHLSHAVTEPEVLLNELQLSESWLKPAKQAAKVFPFKVPHPFLEKMIPGDIHDPLLRQVLPLGEELISEPGFIEDPLAEQGKSPMPGVIHKYHGRALVILNHMCGIHCRYCFRRVFPYQEHQVLGPQWQNVLAYLKADPSIEEVILSGGDPLTLSDRRIGDVVDSLGEISHIKRLRIHSRLPTLIPERLTDSLLSIVTNTRLKPVLVVHVNHANEIDEYMHARLKMFQDGGVHLFNQSVLLKGVNDNVSVLVALSQRLFECQVIPYYLHQLDPVTGAAHFKVPNDDAQKIYEGLQSKLPGYLVPKWVVDKPGTNCKQLL